MRAVFYGTDLIIVEITPEATDDMHRSALNSEYLKHPHEFLIHLITATTTPAGPLSAAEIGCDHISHKHHCGYEECAPDNYKPTTLQFPVRFQIGADFGDNLFM